MTGQRQRLSGPAHLENLTKTLGPQGACRLLHPEERSAPRLVAPAGGSAGVSPAVARASCPRASPAEAGAGLANALNPAGARRPRHSGRDARATSDGQPQLSRRAPAPASCRLLLSSRELPAASRRYALGGLLARDFLNQFLRSAFNGFIRGELRPPTQTPQPCAVQPNLGYVT